ncbi:MAG TPA: hypothetical protein VHC48_03885, partial [Puia sp.]|nr:hypothetical protein [Puia sp.]
PKDIVICDWHYDRPDKTSVLFAMKGFRVVTCPWRNPAYGVIQVKDMVRFRQESTPEMKERFYGIVETTWSPTDRFLREFYGGGGDPDHTPWNCFRTVFEEMGRQAS